MQASEFVNQQTCCGEIREQRITTAGNPGDAIDLMVQGMTPPAQCVAGCWPNEFGPTTVIYPLDLGKSQEHYGLACYRYIELNPVRAIG